MSLDPGPRKRARQRAAIAQKYREKRDPNAMLEAHIRQALERQGIPLERYDPDFIVGTIVTWLGDHRAVLTASGVEMETRAPEPDPEIPSGPGYGLVSEGDPWGYDG